MSLGGNDFRIKTGAGIRDTEMQSSPMSEQLELSVPHTAVLHRIAQCFLSDAKQAQCRLFGDRSGNIAVEKVDVSSVLLGQLPAESFDCRHETKMFQLGGVKLMRQTMDIRGNFLR